MTAEVEHASYRSCTVPKCHYSLTLGTHAPQGYGSRSVCVTVCVCVCVSVHVCVSVCIYMLPCRLAATYLACIVDSAAAMMSISIIGSHALMCHRSIGR